jgi:glycosyltransferase involved in cell wall biosynthesis
MSDRILLFIPCFNCEAQIGRVLNQLHGRVGARIAEVLVLDNGSTDGTQARAVEAASEVTAAPVTVARNHENFHLGGSHKAAFAYATAGGFTHVIVLHGDDQGRLDDIAEVLERGDHHRYDACLGARFMAGSNLQGYSRFRQFGNLAFNLVFSLVAGRAIRDLGSGLNIFGRAIFTDAAVLRASDDLRFNVYLLLGLIDRRLRLMYFPISWRETDQTSNVRLFRQAARTLEIAWDYGARRRHFRTADHRERPVHDYGFAIVARNGSHA